MDINEIIPALEAILFAGGQAAVGAAVSVPLCHTAGIKKLYDRLMK